MIGKPRCGISSKSEVGVLIDGARNEARDVWGAAKDNGEA